MYVNYVTTYKNQLILVQYPLLNGFTYITYLRLLLRHYLVFNYLIIFDGHSMFYIDHYELILQIECTLVIISKYQNTYYFYDPQRVPVGEGFTIQTECS